ncbi:MAG: choice-of-anchor Q domain-containing protein [Roseiflexaceae bacterium]
MNLRARAARAATCCALLVGLLLHASTVSIAHAATIVVSTTADELNADGDCSLREAVRAANLDSPVDGCPAGSGADTIVLAPSVYQLSIAGAEEDAALTGDLDITHDLSITGAGTSATAIDGNRLDRVLDVRGASVHLAHLSIRNGSADTSGGGGVNDAGALTLDDVVVSGNQAAEDGGGVANTGALVLSHSDISDNSSENVGGGITNQGTIAATDSHIMGNTAFTSGGGISNDNSGGVALTGSSVMMNMASRGGGISNVSGAVTVIDSEITGNMATEVDGGGILNEATLTVLGSMVGDNMAHEGKGGGIFNQGGTGSVTASIISGNMSGNRGGGIANSGALTVLATAVVSNTAESHAFPFGYPAYGGGIANSGILTITNSTVSGNMAFDDGGGIYNQADIPGAARLSLNNVTIANNMADSDGQGSGDGGGIINQTGDTVSLQNTIVAGNEDHSSGTGAAVVPDCVGAFDSRGYNLIGDRSVSTCAGFVNGVKGDQVGDHAGGRAIDPALGPLREQGGPTMTESLLAGSPAIDAGNPRGCTDGLSNPLPDDQRGDVRPWGRACDIGAYEYDTMQYQFLPFIRR